MRKKIFGLDKLVPLGAIATSLLAIAASVLIWKTKLESKDYRLLIWGLAALAGLYVILTLAVIYNTPLGHWCRRRFVNLFRRLKTLWLVYKQVHRPWNKYIHGPTRDELIGRVRYAIARRYLDQEAAEINGDAAIHEARYYTNGECPSVIVTDFVNYAELVKTIVNTSLEGIRQRNQGEALLCFTSLRLSLHDWFNFDRGLYSDAEWSDEYLREIEKWSKNARDLIVARHLVCACDADLDLARACGIEGRTKDALSDEMKCWIWRPRGEDGRTHLAPIPRYAENGHSRSHLVQKLKEKAAEDVTANSWLNEIGKHIDEHYAEHRQAFVIVPHTLVDGKSPVAFECGEFQVLGDAFSSGYQTKLPNCAKRLLTYGIAKSDEAAYPESYYAPNDPHQRPIATDFFFVGTVAKSNLERVSSPYELFSILRPTPLVCLEGQDRAKAVHLALLDADKNQNCMNDLVDYISTLLMLNKDNGDLT